MMASATLGVVSLVPGCRSVALHSALGCGLIAPAGRILDLKTLPPYLLTSGPWGLFSWVCQNDADVLSVSCRA